MINCTLIGHSRLYYSQVLMTSSRMFMRPPWTHTQLLRARQYDGKNRGEDVTSVRIWNLEPSSIMDMIGVRRLRASIPGDPLLLTCRLGVRPW